MHSNEFIQLYQICYKTHVSKKLINFRLIDFISLFSFKGETSLELLNTTNRSLNVDKSKEMESESKLVKRVSDQNMLEQSVTTMANLNQSNRSSTARNNNNKRRVKRQKPRQKWNNYNNQHNNYNNNNLNHYPPPLPPNQLGNLNNFNLNNINNMNNLNQLSNLNLNQNLNQPPRPNNYPNINQQTNFANLNPLNYPNLNQLNYPNYDPNLNRANFTNNLNLNQQQLAYQQNLNQNLNQQTNHKRYHHFGNQYSNINQQHNNQHKSNNNNNHFNQNNRKIRKDVRKKREQWANRKQVKEALMNNNQKDKQPFIKKRLQPAPNNTTQFLMDDHNVRESDLEKFKKLIRKETPKKDGLEGTNDENSEQQPKINDRCLHTLNDESSSDEFYSSPDDEQDFIEKQFTETYDTIHAERLDLMSKNELIQEYLVLESKVNVLEDKLKTSQNLSNYQYTSDQSTEEEQSNQSNNANQDALSADLVQAKPDELETTEDYTESSLSVNKNSEKHQIKENSLNKISFEQLQSEIKRLMKENSSLKRENEFLKRSSYNSNNESVLESDDQANRDTMIKDEPKLDQMNNEQEENQSSDSTSSDSEDDDESLNDDNSSDENSEMNGQINDEVRRNEINLIEENANMNSALEQNLEDAEMNNNNEN